MHNKELINITKEIVIAMASTSSQYRAEPDSATELAKAMDIIYKKLVELAQNEPVICSKTDK